MNRLLLILLLMGCYVCGHTQANQLFVKKGIHKKRVYHEGDRIHLRLQNGQNKTGIITRLIDSTIYINGDPIHQQEVAAIVVDGIRKNKLPDLKTMLLIGAGVGLTTVGLSLNHANEPKEALIAGLTIGYAPILIRFIGGRFLYALKKKKYVIGKKFSLRVFDISIPAHKGF